MASTVVWRYDATTQPWLRALYVAAVGVLGGVAVLLFAVAAVGLVAMLWAGDWALRLLVVVLALVGGPLSLLYLLPMLRDPAQRPSLFPADERPLSARAALSLAGGVAVLLAVGWWLDPLVAAGQVAGGVVAGLLYAAAATRGRIDADAATATVGAREWDLSRVTGYRTYRVGPLVVVRFESGGGPGTFGRLPGFLTLPAGVADRATAAFDAVVAADDETAGRESNPTVRWVAGGLALLFAAAGVAGLVFAGPLGWYLAALCWLFAAVLLVVAREG